MRIILLLILISCTTFANAQHTRELTWADLKPIIEFNDPFLELSDQQLHDLALVARFREGADNSENIIDEKKQQQIDSLEKVLRAENIDIEKLLSMRYEIKELRKRSAESVDSALNNTTVKLSGYILPLNYIDNKATEFLLVPWVGACIHTPPPPTNQMVYVKVDEGVEVNSRFKAVSIEGTILTSYKTSTLFLVDGSDEVNSGYSFIDAEIEEL